MVLSVPVVAITMTALVSSGSYLSSAYAAVVVETTTAVVADAAANKHIFGGALKGSTFFN